MTFPFNLDPNPHQNEWLCLPSEEKESHPPLIDVRELKEDRFVNLSRIAAFVSDVNICLQTSPPPETPAGGSCWDSLSSKHFSPAARMSFAMEEGSLEGATLLGDFFPITTYQEHLGQFWEHAGEAGLVDFTLLVKPDSISSPMRLPLLSVVLIHSVCAKWSVVSGRSRNVMDMNGSLHVSFDVHDRIVGWKMVVSSVTHSQPLTASTTNGAHNTTPPPLATIIFLESLQRKADLSENVSRWVTEVEAAKHMALYGKRKFAHLYTPVQYEEHKVETEVKTRKRRPSQEESSSNE